MEHLLSEIDRISDVQIAGRVMAIRGLMMECSGVEQLLSIGSRCRVMGAAGSDGRQEQVMCEVVGFRENRALLMPYGSLEGVGLGSKVIVAEADSSVYPCDAWLGRVVNAMGEPIDNLGYLPRGAESVRLRSAPPSTRERQRVKGKIDLGVRTLNTFLTCCRGQRMGIFAGSGVGKSIMMSMLAKYSQAHVNVIGLIGERSREVQEFIEDDLGEEGLKRSVLVVATSSESALMRRQAAYLTLSISEYFRDKGADVLTLMDSVTRFAMAQREIGLSAGEPPTSKGYTPTVFAELPKLLERAGPGGFGKGSITGLFSVLVEGDDTNEPIADAVRGILDGHIVLERGIAQRGRFPAINVLKSVSRTLPDCNTESQNNLIQLARTLMATYDDMEDMIRLGAYRRGSDPNVDQAIHFHAPLEKFLAQRMEEKSDLATGYRELAAILGVPWNE